ncbi:hypothetical protein APSETT444_008963 [Aspergillus pseudonomiae]
MKRSSVSDNLEPGNGPKSYSCLACRQRKVKCDRCTPCSNCVKAEKQCSFIPPVRGKRKRTKPPREGLHAKLQRYEELLKSYGVKFEPSGDFDASGSETASQSDVQVDEDAAPPSQRSNLEETKPRLIIDKGTSRYFDCSALGLSPFETEMRRRLWWHLAYVDFRLAEVLGTKPSLDLSCSDNQMPLNVEDEDLYPDMVNPPLERHCITTTTPSLIKYEVMESLRKFSTLCPGELRWEALSCADITIMEKDSIISHIEDRLEMKYLRYCDPSDSLHTFVSVMIRTSICKMKLVAHNPRQFANNPIKVPQSERNIFFVNAMKLLDYVIFMQEGSHGLEKYTWHFGTSVLWNVILYVLIEVRHRKTGPDVDKAWRLIGTVFSYYPQVFERSTGPVYTALGKWTLEVWDDHVAALKADGVPEPLAPDYINAINRCRRPAIGSPSTAKVRAVESESAIQETSDQDRVQSPSHEGNLDDGGALDFYDFPSLLSFEMDPNEWVQWEQLVAEQGGFAQGNSM